MKGAWGRSPQKDKQKPHSRGHSTVAIKPEESGQPPLDSD
jgi:hypothetical protein